MLFDDGDAFRQSYRQRRSVPPPTSPVVAFHERGVKPKPVQVRDADDEARRRSIVAIGSSNRHLYRSEQRPRLVAGARSV
jgi:hypothetical protein